MSIDSTALSAEAQQVLEAALRLPDGERAKLVDRLYCSVEQATDPQWEKSWATEVARRAAEMDSGAVKPIPWETALQRIEAHRHGETHSRPAP